MRYFAATISEENIGKFIVLSIVYSLSALIILFFLISKFAQFQEAKKSKKVVNLTKKDRIFFGLSLVFFVATTYIALNIL